MVEKSSFWTGLQVSLVQILRTEPIAMPARWGISQRDIRGNITPIRSRSRQPLNFPQERTLQAKILPLEPQTVDSSPSLYPSQWLLENTPLASLVTETIGDRWIRHSEDLQQLETLADDAFFQFRWQRVKRGHKQVLANELYRSQAAIVNPDAVFDLQLQPIDMAQRQLLSILHIISLYCQLKDNPRLDVVPRTFIFGHVGAQPPDPHILTLIQSLGAILATDPAVCDRLQVVYVPESAKLSQQMYYAADVTEEIATPIVEAVDLNKLKFAANGVLSIGSLGKANYLIQQTVGADNYFSFGLAVPEIELFQKYGYDPYVYYKYYPKLRRAIDFLATGCLTPDNYSQSKLLVDMLLGSDRQMVIADYMFYLAAQQGVSAMYQQLADWTRMSILNVARLG